MNICVATNTNTTIKLKLQKPKNNHPKIQNYNKHHFSNYQTPAEYSAFSLNAPYGGGNSRIQNLEQNYKNSKTLKLTQLKCRTVWFYILLLV